MEHNPGHARSSNTSRLKVLMSAYSCEPKKGSESGIGWNIACNMAKFHDVYVLTRSQNRSRIEPQLSREPVSGLRIIYCDAAAVPKSWDGEDYFAQFHYPLWQAAVLSHARRLHQRVGFDIAHHVSWGRYWGSSRLHALGIPFVWGPVGGGESVPEGFMKSLGPRGIAFEFTRNIVRWLGQHNPEVLKTARSSSIALATTLETAGRLRIMGAKSVEVLGHAAIGDSEFERLSALCFPKRSVFRFLSMGRLLHWKGFHYALRAFTMCQNESSEYWIIGDGPERKRLEKLASQMGVASRVRFFGALKREDALNQLAYCQALLHPSLHDSGGWVCIEAMAAGRPVLCLDYGGPATFVDEHTGVKISPESPGQTIEELAKHMSRMVEMPELARRMGDAARKSVKKNFTWNSRVRRLENIYRQLI